MLAVVSSPSQPDSLKLGQHLSTCTPLKTVKEWSWFDINIPSLKFAEEVSVTVLPSIYIILVCL